MANDFIQNNKNEKVKKVLNEKEEIKWTEPKSENLEPKGGGKGSALVSLYTKKKKPPTPTTSNNSIPPKPPTKKEKILRGKNKPSFFEVFLSYFKGQKSENFKDQKKILFEHQEGIDKEKEKKKEEFVGSDQKHKDIGEVVKERIKESKIDINDGHTIKTNLMDGGPTILIDWKKNILFLFFGLFIVVAIIGALYSFLLVTKYNESAEGEELDREIEIVNSQITVARKSLSEIDELRKKLLISNKILDKHIYWTNFFQFLEENTLENVYYLNGLSGSAEGDYSFRSVTDDYKNITEQLVVLKNNDLVLAADVVRGSLEENEEKSEDDKEGVLKKQIVFDLSLKLAPEIFYR